MAIILDGHSYNVLGTGYGTPLEGRQTIAESVEGGTVVIEAPLTKRAYHLTLLCTIADVATLRQTYAKTATALNLTDEEGFTWSTSAGTNDATHAYSTGVYIDKNASPFDPKPMTPMGWTQANRFTVDIHLRVNATGLYG